MTGINITLQSLPEIGFAHHFYAENYRQVYGIQDGSFELVYVKSGKLLVHLEGHSFEALPGSVFVLFRHLPFRLHSVDNTPHSHCSIQLRGDYSASLLAENTASAAELPGLLLPFVLPPSAEAEKIGRMLHQIIARLSASRSVNAQSCTLAAMGILSDLDSAFRAQLSASQPSALLLSAKIKEYIDAHSHEDISLAQIAAAVKKTPNYLNALFKNANGITIRQYINRRKAVLIAELMVNKNADFRTACENAAITDITYGYRLFKKQLGATPQQYIAAVKKKR